MSNHQLHRFGVALLLSLTAACGASDSGDSTADAMDSTPPTVVSTTPAAGATGVARNQSVTATFSEAMDPGTVTASAFTLTSAASASISGTVIVADATAVLWPAAHLDANVTYTATILPDATDLAGVALAEPYTWTFTTGDTLAPGLTVNLGTAAEFVMLAKSGISTVPPSVITGNLGVSPAAATYLTGFSLTADSSNVFSTSPQVTGKVYAANYASPTPARLTTAVGDMERAFTDAAGRAADVTGLGAGDIGGMTLAPGVYQWGTGLLIPTDVTLAGDATAVWIFQIAQNLTMASATSIVLTGGALPAHVFWQVSGAVTIDTGAHLEGNVLTQTAATLRSGASINGRLLAQTAVTVAGSTVVTP